MQEIYRLVEGQLILGDRKDSFHFGFVYDDNGKIYLEVYFTEESTILNDFWFSADNTTRQAYIEGTTEKGHKVKAFDLFPTNLNKGKGITGKFLCQDKLIYEKSTYDKEERKTDDKIFFIELEGLNIVHTELSEKQTNRANSYRNTDQQMPDSKRDFTTFSINLLQGRSYLTYSGEFYDYPDVSNGNQLLTFKDFISTEVFEKNQEYLIQMLSFINGADVRIRRIYTGKTYTISEVPDSHITETFSFTKISNQYPSDYIPIFNQFKRRGNELISFCILYNKFIEEYSKLDFKSTIFYLNRANENNNLEQKVFTLLIALEELGSKYLKEYSPNQYTIIPYDNFEKIKAALRDTLNLFKEEIPKDNMEFNRLMSKLCDINTQRIDTEEKFFKLFEHASIPRTQLITDLVKQRHSAIHEGEIGKTIQDKWDFFYRLDHILRDIILNRIEYKGVRVKRVSL